MITFRSPYQQAGHFGRRDFLRVGALSFLGIELESFLRAQDATLPAPGASGRKKAEACIMLWLDGGPPQMDTWDPKPTSSFKAISTKVPGIQISELFPQIAKRMDKIAIIRNMSSPDNTHTGGSHYAITGHQVNQSIEFPSFGSIVVKEKGLRNEVPPHVVMNSRYVKNFRAHFIGAEYDPLVLGDPASKNFEIPDLSLPAGMVSERLDNRLELLKAIDHRYRQAIARANHEKLDAFRAQAWQMVLSDSVRVAFDLSKEPDKVRDRYGRDSFGQSCLMARRLIESGSRFVTSAGFKAAAWDTHSDNDKRMKEELGPTLDRGLCTLLDDLQERGLLETTVVIVMGEFGRSYDLNPSGGRDHWCDCWSMLLAGGGIRGGQVVGASDDRGAHPAGERTGVGDVFATIYNRLGVDWQKEYMHPIGRPLKIANSFDDMTGNPIKELV